MSTQLFSQVRYLRDRSMKIDEIIVSRKYVARGFLYAVEKPDGKLCLLVNANDYHVALSSLPSYAIDIINLSNNVMDIPVIESEEKALSVQVGVFQWSSKL